MDKALVIVESSERAAFTALEALKRLDADGTIELYAATIIGKESDGRVTIKAPMDATAGIGTAVGMSMGALIGLLAGPAGAVAGAAIGGAAGAAGDLTYSGFASGFVHQVAKRMSPGMFAVCASVWEDWSEPVDFVVEPLGGVVFRQAADDAAEAQIRADMMALEEAEADLDAQIAQASDEVKGKLMAKREEIKAKRRAERERLEKRANELQARTQEKIASLRQKVSTASAKAKARHEAHAKKLARFAEEQKAAFKELFHH